MPERFPPTPLQIPAETRPTPDWFNLLLWEIVDTVAGENVPRLEYGTPHPNVEKYLGYMLCKEERLDYKTVKRWYASPAVSTQAVWNYDIGFAEESAAHPVYARTYILRREQEAPPAIAPLTKGAAFTGVWQIRVTNGGTGYVPDNPPLVTVTGNATAKAIVSNLGVVSWVVITSEGSGYAAAPTVTIAPSPTVGGSTALAEAKIQLDTAKLVKEDLFELPDDDPRRSIFVRVVRIYETLPGPVITIRNGWDDFGGVEKTTEQKLLVGSTPTNTVIDGVPHVQEIIDEDSVKAKRFDTLRTVGIIVHDIEQVDLQVTGSKARVEYYLVLNSTTIPADSIVADTSSTTYERRRFPKDKNLRVEIKTIYDVPPDYAEDDTGAFAFPTLFYEAYIVPTTGFGILWTRRGGFSKPVVFRHYYSFGTAKVTVTPDAIVEASWVEPFGFRDTALTPASAGAGTPGGPYGRSYTFTDADGNTLVRVLPASTPSLETYLASWVGAEKIVSGSSKVWRPGIFRTTVTKVVML